MNGFCVERVTPHKTLRPHHGVLRATSFAITSDAEEAARRIVQQARDEADRIRTRAQEQAKQQAQATQEKVLRDADILLRALDGAYDSFIGKTQDIVLELVQAMFDKLLIKTPPRKRMEAMLAMLAREVPAKPVDAVLRVHPDDAQLLPELEWPVKQDAAMARGACRLETANGQWTVNFDAAVSALVQALERSAEASAVIPAEDAE